MAPRIFSWLQSAPIKLEIPCRYPEQRVVVRRIGQGEVGRQRIGRLIALVALLIVHVRLAFRTVISPVEAFIEQPPVPPAEYVTAPEPLPPVVDAVPMLP